jgi:hypothetical protein
VRSLAGISEKAKVCIGASIWQHAQVREGAKHQSILIVDTRNALGKAGKIILQL